jgi:restriction system protein
MAVQVLARIPPAVWSVGLICIGAGAVLYARKKGRKAVQQHIAREKAEVAERLLLEAHLAKHSRTLCNRHAALAAANGYGKPDAPKWAKEVQRFMDSEGFSPSWLTPELAHAIVTTYVEARCDQSASPHAVTWTAEAMNDPLSFEWACASQLKALGWEANTTAGSGDQGIDVEARKAGVCVVVQCKLYSQPVGNGAVQEILAGKAFAKAHIAAVVSNAGFTTKAHELAAATGVLLLHYTELGRIDDEAVRLRQSHPARNAIATPVAANQPTGTPIKRGLMGNIKKSA